MILASADGRRGAFAASLFPEIFYALQVLADRELHQYDSWRRRTLAAFPRSTWPLDVPPFLWPALADVPTIGPTRDVEVLLRDLGKLSARAFQERFLIGLFHGEDAVQELLAGGKPSSVIARVPRPKREWLAFIGLYPLDARSRAARVFRRVVEDPSAFQDDVVETLRSFWERAFASCWELLLPELEASVAAKSGLFASMPFAELLRHTLLPIELDRKKKALCALRGGYELRVADMGTCTFTPSVFNAHRLWTTRSGASGEEPWLPYFEPEIGSRLGIREPDVADDATDVALIFRALGDTTRFALVSLLGRQPRTSVELARLLSVSKPTISHHIHILRSAGLIRELEHGGSMMISLRRRPFTRLSERALAHLFESQEDFEPTKTRRQR